jgi:hypothetical protein
MATLSTKSEKLHQISRINNYYISSKQKRVFVSLYGVHEEYNQQNNLRDYKRKSLDWSELLIYSNEKDEDSDSQCVIANRLTSQQVL